MPVETSQRTTIYIDEITNIDDRLVIIFGLQSLKKKSSDILWRWVNLTLKKQVDVENHFTAFTRKVTKWENIVKRKTSEFNVELRG